jgi:hypothetical protein
MDAPWAQQRHPNRVMPERRPAGGQPRHHGYHALGVETTPQAAGALGLYRYLGFREAGRSMIGLFELVWFDLPLLPPPR